MSKGFLKQKAVVMIYLVLSITLMAGFVLADTEQEVCCEQTTGNEICRYTTQDQCDSSFRISSTICEQTSFCKLGTCINEDDGTCSANVAQAACLNADYSWQEISIDDLSQCNKGCCIIGDGAATDWTTKENCYYKQEDLYPDLNVLWDTSYDDERSCINVQYETVKGCCVSEDSCSYVTQSECGLDEQIDIQTGYGFYRGSYCGLVGDNLDSQGLETECLFCKPDDHLGCIGEDVHSFDSCGNDEGVVEDCDYLGGTYCGYDEDKKDYTCKDTYCDDTFDGVYDLDVTGVGKENRNPHDPEIGERRENGESWCVYESPAGGLLDRPGSQHYRAFCWFGEEIIDPCRDYREEICIQDPYYGKGDDFTSAACIMNDIYDSEVTELVSTVPKGNQFWTDSESNDCQEASLSCEVKEVKESNLNKWKVVFGADCLEQNFTNTAAQYCRYSGDCGADYNILGLSTDESFYMTGPEFINTNWNDLYKDRLDDVNSDAIRDLIAQDSYASINATVGQFWLQALTGVGPLPLVPDSLNQDVYYQNTIRTQINDEMWEAWNEYGVHGGLRGLSFIVEDVVAGEYVPGGMPDWLIVLDVAVGATYLVLSIIGSIVAGQLSLTAGFTLFTTSAQTLLAGMVPGLAGGPIAALVVLIVAVIAAALLTILSLTGEKTESYEVLSSCEPWQPPDGGEYCNLCDVPVSEGGLALDDGKGNILKGYECTEYKCHSLGKGCDYITENAGTDRATCYYAYENDASSPIITFAPEFLDEEYNYDTFDVGVEITDLVTPYKEFSFGIKSEDSPQGGPAQCRMDTEMKDTYEEMIYAFPNTYFDTYHNMSMLLLAETEYNFYIRCKDPAGNYNLAPYVIRVTTGAAQDFTPPLILSTSLKNGAYISNEFNMTPVTIYTNEPADCRWSNENMDYELMDVNGLCDQIPASESIYAESECMFALPVSDGENQYYFRCQDYQGNKMNEGYSFTLKGTQPLDITSVSPSEGTHYEDDILLEVTTANGAESGKATCYYDGISFFETNASTHKQQMTNLITGNYNYTIDCIDDAGNLNSTTISFSTAVDTTAPYFLEIYKDATNIYVKLNEEATCEYKDTIFNFQSGEGATLGTGSNFVLPLADSSIYYLTCEDSYGNRDTSTIYI